MDDPHAREPYYWLLSIMTYLLLRAHSFDFQLRVVSYYLHKHPREIPNMMWFKWWKRYADKQAKKRGWI